MKLPALQNFISSVRIMLKGTVLWRNKREELGGGYMLGEGNMNSLDRVSREKDVENVTSKDLKEMRSM